MEEFKGRGLFWLPDLSEHKVPGEIYFLPNQGISIILNGIIDNNITTNVRKYLVMFGEIHGKGRITLFDIFETKRNINYKINESSSAMCEAKAMFLFVGEFFHLKQDILCNSINFTFNGLDEWLGKSGFKFPEKYPEFSCIYKKPESLSFLITSTQKKIIFDWSVYYPSFRPIQTECNIQQEGGIIIKDSNNKEFPFFKFRGEIRKLLNLFTLLLNKKIFLKTISLNLKTQNKPPLDIKKIEIYYPINFWKEDMKVINYWDMLFTFDSLKDNFELLLNKWFESYNKLGYILDDFMGTIYNDGMFLSHIFLSRVQTIEIFHRSKYASTERSTEEFEKRLEMIKDKLKEHKKISEWLQGKLKHANEVNLQMRFKEILNKYNKLLNDYISDIESFSKKIMDTRNYYIHLDPRLKNDALSEIEMHPYIVRLKIIMLVLLFDELGISEKLISTVLNEKYSINFVPELK